MSHLPPCVQLFLGLLLIAAIALSLRLIFRP